METMSISDATVTLRSLPRRYREVVSGPVGDDAWDRLVRTVGDGERSALGWTRYTTHLVKTLATAVLELSLTVRPTIDLAGPRGEGFEAGPTTVVEDVTAELSSSVDRAVQAVAARSREALDRKILVDGKEVPARLVVDLLVREAAGHIRDAEAALQAARDAS